MLRKVWCTVVLLSVLTGTATCGVPTHRDSVRAIQFKLEAGPEYMAPYHHSRQIQTISADLMLGVQFFRKVRLSLYGGGTMTYAWGNIIEWDQNFQDVKYSNSAFGAGPAFIVRVEPVISRHVSLSADISGALILYTAHFPAGGDIYNFMWRLGPSVLYHINDRCSLVMSAKWMHVSNGQGLNPHNPSYEAVGGAIHFIYHFPTKASHKQNSVK